jgi:hypothetical protein
MISPAIISLEDERVVATRGAILAALGDKFRLGEHRLHLRNAADELHALLAEWESDELWETDAGCYLRVFDALAFLTDAVRWPGVKPTLLRRALSRLS